MGKWLEQTVLERTTNKCIKKRSTSLAIKCKSKHHWDFISPSSEQLSSRKQLIKNAGKDAGVKESLYSLMGM
jgi:hypothetical protein